MFELLEVVNEHADFPDLDIFVEVIFLNIGSFTSSFFPLYQNFHIIPMIKNSLPD